MPKRLAKIIRPKIIKAQKGIGQHPSKNSSHNGHKKIGLHKTKQNKIPETRIKLLICHLFSSNFLKHHHIAFESRGLDIEIINKYLNKANHSREDLKARKFVRPVEYRGRQSKFTV